MLANSASTTILPQEWKHYWNKVNKSTSSSPSGLHFEHYKSLANSPYLSHFHATKLTATLSVGQPYDCWKQGVTVMLETELGINLVSKLRAILLMEADFNASNKLKFGKRMLHSIQSHHLMPEEIFSKQGWTPLDSMLSKILFYNIFRQLQYPADCFGRCIKLFWLHMPRHCQPCLPGLGSYSNCSQNHVVCHWGYDFFLHIDFGDSTTFAGGGIEYKTQGMCQGNGTAAAALGVVSITIINAHKRHHTGAWSIICVPNICSPNGSCSILFVDDTDWMHLDLSHYSSPEEVHCKITDSIHNWGSLLIATGGAL